MVKPAEMRRYQAESLRAEAEMFKLHEILDKDDFDSLVQQIYEKLDPELFLLYSMDDIPILQDVVRDIRINIGNAYFIN